jgi:hypothetical protein
MGRLLIATSALWAGLVLGAGAAHAATPFPSSGWSNPTGSSFEDWHFGACDGYYEPGFAHLGADSQGTRAGQVVVALGPGTVTGRSDGWPGSAIGIEHVAGDGARFLGVYGHILPEVGIGATVQAGQRIGTLYNWDSNSHLHLGVRPLGAGEGSGSGMLRGRSACSGGSAPLLGYVNPLPWLAAHGRGQTPPPPPPDTDGDGVPDAEDACPTTKGDDGRGCPSTLGVPFDANGDGRIDLVHRWSGGVNTWLSNGDGGYTIRGHAAPVGYGYAQGVWFAADVDGDGRTDLVHRWGQGVNTWLSNGDGGYTIRGHAAHPGYDYSHGNWFASDANADSKTDLVHRWGQGVNTWLSNGDGTYAIRGHAAQSGYDYDHGNWFASDANADGKTDLVHRWGQGVNTWLSNGDGGYTIRGHAAHAGYGYGDGVWFAADANGDGRTDLVHRWSGAVNTWLSNGDGGYTIRGHAANAGYGYTDGVWFAADANGDGRTDLVHRWSGAVNTWLSNGDGGYTIRGHAAQAGYGYTDGQWPASLYSYALIRRPPPSSAPGQAPAGSAPPPANPAAPGGSAKRAPARCVVPRLRGMTLAKAKRRLRARHCRVGKVRRVNAPRAVVKWQSRKPGRRLPPGTKVHLRVGSSTHR